MGGVVFADFNDLESVKRLVNDRTCAVILETVQGEGGIFPAEPAFLTGLRELCDEKDILLILDEIQCGMGRTGTMWAFSQYGVKPDIMTCAKALGCGVPVGAFVLNEKTAERSLVPGDHGSTYGGNPFAMSAVNAVAEIFGRDRIVDHVQRITPYFTEALDSLMEKHPSVTAHRGAGLMQGLEFNGTPTAGQVAAEALRRGLLIITAGHDVLRFVPPLIITEKEIDEAAAILDASISALEKP